MNQFFGPYQPSEFLAYYLFAMLGAVLMLLFSTIKRDPNATSTPVHFSLSFLLSDNVKRIVATLLLIYIAIRFAEQFLGMRMEDWKAIGLGFGSDRLSQLFKDKLGVLKVDRNKIN